MMIMPASFTDFVSACPLTQRRASRREASPAGQPRPAAPGRGVRAEAIARGGHGVDAQPRAPRSRPCCSIASACRKPSEARRHAFSVRSAWGGRVRSASSTMSYWPQPAPERQGACRHGRHGPRPPASAIDLAGDQERREGRLALARGRPAGPLSIRLSARRGPLQPCSRRSAAPVAPPARRCADRFCPAPSAASTASTQSRDVGPGERPAEACGRRG
jgi:hypothetical protein